MRYALLDGIKNEILLLSRILLVILFVLFGYLKLVDFHGTTSQMAAEGLAVPSLSAIVAIAIEFLVGIAVLVSYFTRPFALLLAAYTLATAFIGHHYWTMSGAAHLGNMINFYKNLAIVGGFLLLCLMGPGEYSMDRR